MRNIINIIFTLFFVFNFNEKCMADKTPERKLSASTIFQGLANSCVQVGQVASAQSSKEKQQATCNLIGSVFQLAADIAKETEGKNSSRPTNQKPTANPQTYSQNTGTSAQPSSLTAKTIEMTLKLLPLLSPEEKKSTVYLKNIDVLANDTEKRIAIAHLLADKEHAPLFLEELFSHVNKISARYIQENTQGLSNLVAQRTIPS